MMILIIIFNLFTHAHIDNYNNNPVVVGSPTINSNLSEGQQQLHDNDIDIDIDDMIILMMVAINMNKDLRLHAQNSVLLAQAQLKAAIKGSLEKFF